MTAIIHLGGDGPRIDQAIIAWLDSKFRRSKSDRTVETYRETIMSFRQALLAVGADLDSDPRIVTLAAQGWAGAGDPAPATYNQRLAAISSFYTYARRTRLLELSENPVAGDRIERAHVELYQGALPLDINDVRAIMGAIDRSDLEGERDYCLLWVALSTGRRLAELAGLRLGDVRASAAGAVTLTFRRLKGGSIGTNLLSGALSASLRGYLHKVAGAQWASGPADGPIWVSLSNYTRGRPLSPQGVRHVVRRRLGVSRVHALRHTFASLMLQTGAPVTTLQGRLGHKNLQTTGHYARALEGAINPYADQLDAALGVDVGK